MGLEYEILFRSFNLTPASCYSEQKRRREEFTPGLALCNQKHRKQLQDIARKSYLSRPFETEGGVCSTPFMNHEHDDDEIFFDRSILLCRAVQINVVPCEQ